MRITTKGFYAVEIMRALAGWETRTPLKAAGLPQGLPMSLADIEKQTGVPRNYVARLTLCLKKAGLTKSYLGNAGGYRIAKKPKDISLADIFIAAGEDIAPWNTSIAKNAKRPIICPLHPVWQKLYAANKVFFEKTTLEDFL